MSMRPQRKKLTEDAIEQARKVISDHFSGVEVQLSGPISERDNSKVFYAVIDTAKRLEAAVKLCLVPQTQIPDESSAREQYVALERVNSALANGNPRYRVPTPLYLAADLAVFVMSWVEGESLTNKLRQSATFNDGTRWFEGIGAWLGNFHKAGPIRRQLIDLDERLKVIEDLCASPLPSESFKRALTILQKAAPTLKGIEVEVSWLHGDCKTDNFFLSGQNIYGIDISLSYENPVEYDLAQFLNNLSLQLTGPKYLYLQGIQSNLEEAFWRGYRDTGPSVSLAYLNWLRLSFSLSFWHTMLRNRKWSIRTWILNRMFTRLADRLTVKISETLLAGLQLR